MSDNLKDLHHKPSNRPLRDERLKYPYSPFVGEEAIQNCPFHWFSRCGVPEQRVLLGLIFYALCVTSAPATDAQGLGVVSALVSHPPPHHSLAPNKARAESDYHRILSIPTLLSLSHAMSLSSTRRSY